MLMPFFAHLKRFKLPLCLKCAREIKLLHITFKSLNIKIPLNLPRLEGLHNKLI